MHSVLKRLGYYTDSIPNSPSPLGGCFVDDDGIFPDPFYRSEGQAVRDGLAGLGACLICNAIFKFTQNLYGLSWIFLGVNFDLPAFIIWGTGNVTGKILNMIENTKLGRFRGRSRVL